MEFAKNDTHFEKPAPEAQVKYCFLTNQSADAKYENIRRIITVKKLT